MSRSCTGRIQERLRQGLHSTRESVANSSCVLVLTEVAKAVRDSQVWYGFKRIPQVFKILHSAFVDNKEREVNAVVRPSLKANLGKYILPIATSLGVRYAVSQVPYLSGSGAETMVSHLVTIPCFYLTARLLADNTLFTFALMKAHDDEMARINAKLVFDSLSWDLANNLSSAFAKKGQFAELQSIIQQKMNGTFSKYFENPDLFRKVTHQNLREDFSDIFASVLIRKESDVSPTAIALPLSDVMADIMLASLFLDYVTPIEQFKEKLYKALRLIQTREIAKFSADSILRCISGCKELQKIIEVMPEEKEEVKVNPSQQICFSSILRNPLEYLSAMIFIALTARFLPFGNQIAFILNAELYGRGLLELKIGSSPHAERLAIMSDRKALTFGLGLPFALVVTGVESWFLRDALLSVMLQLWTLAELEDPNQFDKNKKCNGWDHFYISQKGVDVGLWLAGKIAFYRPQTGERLVTRIRRMLLSPKLDWAVAGVLGDPSKFPKIKWVPDVVKKAIKEGISKDLLIINGKPDATEVILYQIPSMSLFLKYYGKYASDKISVARKIRVIKPWVVSPVLLLLSPGFLVSAISLVLYLLKSSRLEEIFNQLNAIIERAGYSELKQDEQAVNLQVKNLLEFVKDFPDEVIEVKALPPDSKPVSVVDDKPKTLVVNIGRGNLVSLPAAQLSEIADAIGDESIFVKEPKKIIPLPKEIDDEWTEVAPLKERDKKEMKRLEGRHQNLSQSMDQVRMFGSALRQVKKDIFARSRTFVNETYGVLKR